MLAYEVTGGRLVCLVFLIQFDIATDVIICCHRCIIDQFMSSGILVNCQFLTSINSTAI